MINLHFLRNHLLEGQVIPALPLALDRKGRWSERHQRAVIRYYLEAGVGGIAVGVHSTQFEIRDPKHGLYAPVLELATDTIRRWLPPERGFVRIAGLCGRTPQALREADIARNLGFEAGLLSLGVWRDASERAIVEHCARVSESIPLIGFYMQPAVGGRLLSYRFWRKLSELPGLVAVKIAPFNRYQTLDVVRAVIDSGRSDVALYTGNDDNIIADLLTSYRFGRSERVIAGGLLGQWGVWTERAVRLLVEIKTARRSSRLDRDWFLRNAALTDANAAIFDAANGFSGCLPGIHEVLRRSGIFATTKCLNPKERLSPGQAAEIDRVAKAYPWLVDDEFIAARVDRWLS